MNLAAPDSNFSIPDIFCQFILSCSSSISTSPTPALPAAQSTALIPAKAIAPGIAKGKALAPNLAAALKAPFPAFMTEPVPFLKTEPAPVPNNPLTPFNILPGVLLGVLLGDFLPFISISNPGKLSNNPPPSFCSLLFLSAPAGFLNSAAISSSSLDCFSCSSSCFFCVSRSSKEVSSEVVKSEPIVAVRNAFSYFSNRLSNGIMFFSFS